jgi:hypothetical protein
VNFKLETRTLWASKRMLGYLERSFSFRIVHASSLKTSCKQMTSKSPGMSSFITSSCRFPDAFIKISPSKENCE